MFPATHHISSAQNQTFSKGTGNYDATDDNRQRSERSDLPDELSLDRRSYVLLMPLKVDRLRLLFDVLP